MTDKNSTLEQAARMLRKYHRLCVEVGRGDSYWLGEILATEAALAAQQVRATPPTAPVLTDAEMRDIVTDWFDDGESEIKRGMYLARDIERAVLRGGEKL